MIEEIKIGDKNVLFARHNGRLIYPKYPSTENLVLHYDFSGCTNLDVQKGIAEDLSGNGNDGVLQNFAYIDGSGYLDNALIFDGIDDFITIPESQIDLDNFTYSEGINVISFRGDNVATVVDGVIEIGGRNLAQLTNSKEWVRYRGGAISFGEYKGITTIKSTDNGSGYIGIQQGSNARKMLLRAGEQYIISLLVRGTVPLTYNYIMHTGAVNSNFGNFTYEQPLNEETFVKAYVTKTGTADYELSTGSWFMTRPTVINEGDWVEITQLKIEKGTKATDWTPAPEDVETTTFKPFFDNKIKSALYWNRALTDEELLQVYNTQIKRT